MSNRERQKGLRGQQEVQRILRGAGFDLRTLGAQGDSLAFSAFGTMFHVEVKRQERLRLPEWLQQAEAEAPEDAVPVVVFRQTERRRRPVSDARAGIADSRSLLERGEWMACLPLRDLVRMGE